MHKISDTLTAHRDVNEGKFLFIRKQSLAGTPTACIVPECVLHTEPTEKQRSLEDEKSKALMRWPVA